MAKSSINFARSNRGNFKHNDRSQKEPTYLLPKQFRKYDNEVSCDAHVAEMLLEELLWDAKRNYKDTFGQKLQAKTYIWEAVVNLNERHTLEDAERLAKAIEKETGFTTLQIAVHYDEGHVNEQGMPQFNFHAHLSFFTLDGETGQQLYRRQITVKQRQVQPNLKPMNKNRLSKLQDLTAEILEMERGQKGAGRPHLTPKQFREFKKLENRVEEYEQDYEYHGELDPDYCDGVRWDFMHRAEVELRRLKVEFEALKEKNRELSKLLGEKDAKIVLLTEKIPEFTQGLTSSPYEI